MKRILKIDDCWFFFPDGDGMYYRIEIRNGNAYCGQRWKEIKLYEDGSTDLMDVCEMLVKIQKDFCKSKSD